MESVSTPILIVLAIVAFNNYRKGTLGTWLTAKFFNSGAPKSAATNASSSGSPSFQLLSTNATRAGVLTLPVTGPITGRFGDPRPGHRHGGVDIAVPIGTPVHAAGAGRVSYVGPSAGYGLRVDVDHGGGVVTRYGHLSAFRCSIGDAVTGGSVIALSGNTGESSGPHVHFEVRVGGTAVDPLAYISNPAGVAV